MRAFCQLDGSELLVEPWDVLDCRDPEALDVEAVVPVHDDVSRGDHLAPRNAGAAVAQLGREPARRLAKRRQVVDDSLLGPAVSFEGLLAVRRQVSDVRERWPHIGDPKHR